MKKKFAARFCLILALFILPGMVHAADERRQNGELKSYQGVQLGSVNDFRENSILGVQKVDVKKYRLKIDGLVQKPLSYTYDQLKSLPHQKKLVTVHCVEGWKVAVLWEGIPFSEFASRAGVAPRAVTAVFHSVDGYSTSLPLKTVTEKNMILADSANGIPLPAALGFPFILVAEDKWGYKWARWIERIEFSARADYRGYWEQRGYNQKGDLSGPELEGP